MPVADVVQIDLLVSVVVSFPSVLDRSSQFTHNGNERAAHPANVHPTTRYAGLGLKAITGSNPATSATIRANADYRRDREPWLWKNGVLG